MGCPQGVLIASRRPTYKPGVRRARTHNRAHLGGDTTHRARGPTPGVYRKRGGLASHIGGPCPSCHTPKGEVGRPVQVCQTGGPSPRGHKMMTSVEFNTLADPAPYSQKGGLADRVRIAHRRASPGKPRGDCQIGVETYTYGSHARIEQGPQAVHEKAEPCSKRRMHVLHCV